MASHSLDAAAVSSPSRAGILLGWHDIFLLLLLKLLCQGQESAFFHSMEVNSKASGARLVEVHILVMLLTSFMTLGTPLVSILQFSHW